MSNSLQERTRAKPRAAQQLNRWTDMAILQASLGLLLLAAACSPESGASSEVATRTEAQGALAGLSIPSSWGVASSSGGGPSELIRYREHGDGVRKAGLHVYRLEFTRPYEQFPSGDRESREVDQLEDDLCKLLEPGNQAVLWLVRTGDGKRRWVFYAASTDETVARLERARELISARGATMSAEPDPAWSMYDEFTPR